MSATKKAVTADKEVCLKAMATIAPKRVIIQYVSTEILPIRSFGKNNTAIIISKQVAVQIIIIGNIFDILSRIDESIIVLQIVVVNLSPIKK